MPEENDRLGDPIETPQGDSALADLNVSPPPLLEAKPSQPLWVWAGLGGLVLAALFVIFVLPSIVQDYELPLAPRVEAPTTSSAAGGNAAVDTGISPFLAAQQARERKEAQDVLAVLLDRQLQLDSLRVEEWAGDAYASALADAAQGDESYRAQAFDAAAEAYARGLETLTALLTALPTELAQSLVTGEQGLVAGDAQLAIEAYELAALFEGFLADLADAEQNGASATPRPDPSPAQIGLTRARALDGLTDLFDAAARLRDKPEEQIVLLERAVSLDPFSKEAESLLAEVRAALLQRQFSQAMSQGYERLRAGAPTEAIARFEAAAALGINSAEATAAIAQTQTELANAELSFLQQAARVAEEAEDWSTAVGSYEAMVAIDANLAAVNASLDYAGKRARLDALLVAALDAPERFAEPEVFEETRDVYFTGRGIEQPGERLRGQLDALQLLLESSQIPLSIRFISDGLTEVTVLRVSELGAFEATRLDLKPGRYAAVGKRAGFREVREEFTVGFGLTPAVVIVRCDEPIGSALGR